LEPYTFRILAAFLNVFAFLWIYFVHLEPVGFGHVAICFNFWACLVHIRLFCGRELVGVWLAKICIGILSSKVHFLNPQKLLIVIARDDYFRFASLRVETGNDIIFSIKSCFHDILVMMLDWILILDWAWTYVAAITSLVILFFFNWVLDSFIQWCIFSRER